MWKAQIFTLAASVLLFLCIGVCFVRPAHSFGITISNAAYRDVVIEIQDSVPMDQCAQVLNDLEVSVNATAEK